MCGKNVVYLFHINNLTFLRAISMEGEGVQKHNLILPQTMAIVSCSATISLTLLNDSICPSSCFSWGERRRVQLACPGGLYPSRRASDYCSAGEWSLWSSLQNVGHQDVSGFQTFSLVINSPSCSLGCAHFCAPVYRSVQDLLTPNRPHRGSYSAHL